MNNVFKLPSMGEGVQEATIVKWLKKPGDKVAIDEPVIEVSTDKVDTEVVSPQEGHLIAIFAKVDDVVPVGAVLAQIDSNPKAEKITVSSQDISHQDKIDNKDEHFGKINDVKDSVQKTEKETFNKNIYSRPISLGEYAGHVRSSPLVRKLAKEHNVNLYEVNGSGLYGRITKDDFYSYINDHVPKKIARFEKRPDNESSFSFEDQLFRLKTKVNENEEYLDGVKVRRQSMSRIRKLTAESMLRSVRISPHVTTTFEIDFSKVMQFKDREKGRFREKYNQNLTITAFLISSAVYALKEHPIVNASVDGNDILLKDDINIGCAVAINNGLIVPVLKKLNDISLGEIAIKLGDIVQRARAKELKPEEIMGGTFTVTNPGMYGSLHSQPIINQPQVAIMSAGAMCEQLFLLDDSKQVQARPVVQIGLTFDHRIIDGELGAKFLNSVKSYLENSSNFSI